MNNQLVSIIMSVHKVNPFLDDAINSILKQTHEKFEFLIVQDGIEDEDLSLRLKFYEARDSRIILLQNKENLGLTKSLNILVKESNSNYIFRQDADDISRTERIRKQLEFLTNNSLDACFAQAVNSQTGKILHRKSLYIPTNLLLKIKNPFVHGTMLIKKNVLESVGFYDERFTFSQDYKLYIDLVKSKKKLKQINEILYELNTIENISTNFKNQQKYFANCARKNLIPINK
tara:strand:+ start:3842 stop:4537 length:696 start_codon:yes stop_codon:yes gene_type:complete